MLKNVLTLTVIFVINFLFSCKREDHSDKDAEYIKSGKMDSVIMTRYVNGTDSLKNDALYWVDKSCLEHYPLLAMKVLQKAYSTDSIAEFIVWNIKGYEEKMEIVAPYLSNTLKELIIKKCKENNEETGWSLQWRYFTERKNLFAMLDTIPSKVLIHVGHYFFERKDTIALRIMASRLTDQKIADNFYSNEINILSGIIKNRKIGILTAMNYKTFSSYFEAHEGDYKLMNKLLIQHWKKESVENLIYNSNNDFMDKLIDLEMKDDFYNHLISKVKTADQYTIVENLFQENGDSGWKKKLWDRVKL